MATALTFKDVIDLPLWRPLGAPPASLTAGTSFCCDLRNNEDRHPFIYLFHGSTSFSAYAVKNDEWITLSNPAMSGTFGNGAVATFAPAAGPSGTLVASSDGNSVTLSTALPNSATVGINQLANRGDGSKGFKIRIIGNASGSSGKTEERYIVANTAGATPQIWLDSPLSFTPKLGDGYEILSGRAFLLNGGTVASGIFKSYDVATNSFNSVALATSGLPATIGSDTGKIVLDELYVPATANPGDGFYGQITCSGSSSTTIVGKTSSGGDFGLATDEYKNFQIRIVEDTTNPQSVGQRRKITGQSVSGSVSTYTVSAWTSTPTSGVAKFVIEYPNQILVWTQGQSATYTYDWRANSWNTTWSFAARGGAAGNGVTAWSGHGITLDTAHNARHSFIYSTRGGGATTIDCLDIAANTWSNGFTYGNLSSNVLWNTGSSSTYDPATNGGKYCYLVLNGGQRLYRFDVLTRVIEPWGGVKYSQSTAVTGEKMATTLFVDGSTKLAFVVMGRQSVAEMVSVAAHR